MPFESGNLADPCLALGQVEVGSDADLKPPIPGTLVRKSR